MLEQQRSEIHAAVAAVEAAESMAKLSAQYDEGALRAIGEQTIYEMLRISTGADKVDMDMLSKAVDIWLEMGPTLEDLREGIDYWLVAFEQITDVMKERDQDLYQQFAVSTERLNLDTWDEIFKDQQAAANALAGFMDMIGTTGSPLAGLFGAYSGAIMGTGMELKLAKAFGAAGLDTLPHDIISGLGSILGGIQQNQKQQGEGFASILMGIGSMFGVGGPWMQIIGGVLGGIFGRRKKKKSLQRLHR